MPEKIAMTTTAATSVPVAGTRPRLRSLISLFSVLSQGLLDHPFKLYRDLGRELSERYRLSFEDRNNHVARRCAVEGYGTGEHLVDHDAEAKDVTARIDRQSARLLGRHISDRAHHQS